MFIDSRNLSGRCSCGHPHTVSTKTVLIEAGCLERFDYYSTKYELCGKKAIIYDENTYSAKNCIHPKADREIILPAENLHADETAVNAVLEKLDSDIKILIAFGSGTVHDITRYCVKKRNLRFISCPTAASVDGFCSTVCAMTWNGYKKTMPGIAPEIVIADTDIIKEAPMNLTLAGIGDIIGKYTALADWKISHILAGEFFCPVIEQMTKKALMSVHNHCEQICDRDKNGIEQLMHALILSGLAMQLIGNSRPASGSEHHISHLIEMAPPMLPIRFNTLHGEKVGVGTLLVADVYHSLAKTEDIGSYVKPYDFPSTVLLEKFYGKTLSASVVAENKNDCMNGVSDNMLIAKWPDIREIIAEIPTQEELLRLYTKINAKKNLGEIGVSENHADLVLEYSPTVRNRMTLMRIRRMLSL